MAAPFALAFAGVAAGAAAAAAVCFAGVCAAAGFLWLAAGDDADAAAAFAGVFAPAFLDLAGVELIAETAEEGREKRGLRREQSREHNANGSAR